MIVLKKTSKLGRAQLARTGSLATHVALKKDDNVRIHDTGTMFDGDLGTVKWTDDLGSSQERVGVVFPGIDGLQFFDVKHVKKVGP